MKTTLFRAVTGVVFLFSTGIVYADNTWDGGGANDNWTTANNWGLNTLPTLSSTVNFAGSTRLTPNNDNTAATTVGGVTFSSGAGAFTLGGNSITLGGNITNSSTNLQTINNDLILNANRTVTSTTGNIAIGGAVSGAFQLTKGGAGTTLTLTGNNSFSNGVRVDGGVLSFSTIADTGTNSNIGNGGNITGNVGTLQYTGATASSNRSILFINNAQQSVLEVTNSTTNLTLSGSQSDNDSATLRYLVKTGAGTLTLTGIAGGSNLNLAVRIDAGTLVSNSTATANSGRLGGAIINNGGTVQLSGNNNQISPGNNTANGDVAVNAGGTLDLLSSQNIGTLSTTDAGGTITSSTSGSKTLTVSSSTNNSTFGGTIQNGSGTLALTKSGAGTTLTLSGTANTYTGTTSITGGTINAAKLANGGSSSSIGSSANTVGLLTFAGGTLQYTGSTAQSTDHLFTINTGGATLDASGTGSGTLSFTNTGDLSTGSGATARSLTLAGSNTGTNVLASNLNAGSSTISLNKVDGGTWALTGTNTYTGTTTISGGSLQIGTGGTSGSLTATSSIINNANLTINRSNAFSQASSLGAGAVISGTGSFTQAGSGTTTLTAANTYQGTTTISNGSLHIGSGGTTGSLTATSSIINNANLTIDRSDAFSQANSLGVNAVISGTGSFTQAGSGTTTLTAANTYQGTTTISNGSLHIGSGGTTGSLTATSSIINNGNLTIDRSDAFSQANSLGVNAVISGTGSFTQAGSGTTTLTAANSYSGGTTIVTGTLLANNTTGSAVGTGSVLVNSTGTFGGTGSISGAVTLAGGVLSPGASIESLTVGSAGGTGTLLIEYDGSAGTPIDVLNVTGNFDITNISLNFASLGSSLTAQAYIFATYGSLTGLSFSSILNTPSGYSIDYQYSGNNIALLSAVAVPEPGTFAFLAIVATGIILRCRQQKRSINLLAAE